VRGLEQSRRQFIDGIMAVSRFYKQYPESGFLHCAATYASDGPAKGHSGWSERFVASAVGRISHRSLHRRSYDDWHDGWRSHTRHDGPVVCDPVLQIANHPLVA
jgi:hypothetical protein